MDDALHDVERVAGAALHTIIGLKRRISAHQDGSDLYLVHDELVQLSTLLEDIDQLHNKTFSGTPKENLDILKAIYQDICVVLKTFEELRQVYPNIEDDHRKDPQHHFRPELSAERRSRPVKERIALIHRHLKERRVSLLSKLVVLNTLIETYPDENVFSQHNKPKYGSQRLIDLPLEPDARHHVDVPSGQDWSEQKSVPHHFENEKYLSSEMFPVFKHMRQETLRTPASKSGVVDDSLQSPRSPSMHQLALSDMHYERSKRNEVYFQHLEQAFSKITHSPPINRRGTRPFSIQGQPRVGASMCSPRCRCHCHSNRSVAHLSLSAFKSTLGAFAFSFTGPSSGTGACTDLSCRSHRARWLRITYVFPSWLFSAAITASFSDGIGSPELLLRVCRVISAKNTEGYYNIFGYISRKDVDGLKKAIQRKEVAITDVLDTGMTAIAVALRHFNLPMVQFLLQEGADLFQEGPSGVTSSGFMMAIEKLYTDTNMPRSERTVLEEMLPLDTIIEMAGLSPLHKVVLGIRCLHLGELLRLNVCPVDQMDYSGRTALQWAAAKGDAAAISELLEAGAQLEYKTRLRSESPLMIACRTGANPEAVKMLLAAGADINAKDCYGQTPLILGVAAPGGRDRIEIVGALLDAGADVNSEQGFARATPLAYACVASNMEMVKFLINAGADVSRHDRDGSTVLMNAVIYHACEAATVLLKHGVDIRATDNEGKTVLHCIAEVSNEDMMRVFALAGAWCVVDPEQRDDNGLSPLDTFDQRTMSAAPGLREKFLELLQIFAQRHRHSLSTEEAEADGELFFDALDSLDDEDDTNAHGSS